MLGQPQRPSLFRSGMARPTSLDHYLRVPIRRILLVMEARPKTYFKIITSHTLSLSCSPRSYSSRHTTAYPDSPDSDVRSDSSFFNRYPRCCRYDIVKNVGTLPVAVIVPVGHGTPDQPRSLFTNPDSQNPPCHVGQTQNLLQILYVSSAITVMFFAIL